MNGLQITSIIYRLLAGSEVKAAISGDIYKNVRPKNSGLEDVVVNTLTASFDQLQSGTANVNIHVPSLSVEIDGRQDEQPDTARMEVLAGMAEVALRDVWEEDWHIEVSQPGLLIEDNGTYYVNIRIKYYSINLN